MARRPLAMIIALVLTVSACEPGDDPGASGTERASASSPVKDCSKASARDFDGDGKDDVAVGNRMIIGGQVSILSADRLVPLTIPDEAADGIGAAVAVGPLPDGRTGLLVAAPGEHDDGGGRQRDQRRKTRIGDAPAMGVTVYDPATGASKEIKSRSRGVEGVGEVLG